jgi:uncharacterized protein (DUF3820 family)
VPMKLLFGKYKGYDIVDLVFEDQAYLEWLLLQDWFLRENQYLAEKINDLLNEFWGWDQPLKNLY